MQPKSLSVRAVGAALVQDHERLETGTTAFIGRKFIETSPGRFGFAPTGKAVTVPYRAEYVKALRDGDLEAGDEATAKVAGVKFVSATTPAEAGNGDSK